MLRYFGAGIPVNDSEHGHLYEFLRASLSDQNVHSLKGVWHKISVSDHVTFYIDQALHIPV